MRFLWAYAGAGLMFLAADALWLGLLARSFYRDNLGSLMVERPLLGPAALFYLGYIAAIVFFATLPALREQSWTTALLYGAALGAAAYGTYDLTNLATLKDWPPIVSVIDLIWGAVATSVAATAGFCVSRYMQG